jgi:hypothetical protein
LVDDQVFRCKSPFAHFVNGQPFVVAAGQLVRASDAAYKANPVAFETVLEHVEGKRARVEQATKAPGEMRNVTPPTAASKSK